jgi:ribonuclease M5
MSGMEKISIGQAVVVEGKYDQIRLSSVLDAVIIPTNGFGIFSDWELLAFIRRLAESKGVVVMTDSDAAGFQIRSFLSGAIPADKIIHAYIPDILGKERRKTVASKEGKLGVEGMNARILLDALQKAGVTCSRSEENTRKITHTDLFEDGVSGGPNSKEKRTRLLGALSLPARLSTGAMLRIMNTFLCYEAYKNAVDSL